MITFRCAACDAQAFSLQACHLCGELAGVVARAHATGTQHETRGLQSRVDAAFPARCLPVVRVAGERPPGVRAL